MLREEGRLKPVCVQDGAKPITLHLTPNCTYLVIVLPVDFLSRYRKKERPSRSHSGVGLGPFRLFGALNG